MADIYDRLSRGSIYDRLDKQKKERFAGETTDLSRKTSQARNALEALSETGQMDEFSQFQKSPDLWSGTWNVAKNLGSRALDVVSRTGYAAGGAAEEAIKGTPEDIPMRIARELFSGVGVKGNKKFMDVVVKENSPGYAKFAEEHPILSIGSDLAIDIATDPMTYTPTTVIQTPYRILKAGSKVARKVALSTKAGRKGVQQFEKSFVPNSQIRHGVEERVRLGHLPKGTNVDEMINKVQDSIDELELLHRGDLARYSKQGQAILKGMQKAGLKPEEFTAVREAVMTGKIAELPDNLRPFAEQYQKMTRAGYGELTAAELAAGKEPTPALIDYYHHNPAAQTAQGLYETGDISGARTAAASGAKEKILRTPEQISAWEKAQGLKPEDYGRAFAIDIMDFGKQTANSIFKMRLTDTIKNMGLETNMIRKLPAGTNTPFAMNKLGIPILKKGEAIWMPEGNLRFYSQNMKDIIGKDILEALDKSGGIVTGKMMDKINAAISAATKIVVNTTSSGITNTTGPLKKLEEVVSGALEARGMTKGEASGYINKLKSGENGLTTTIENITTVNEDKLASYIKTLINEATNTGAKVSPQLLEKLNKTVLAVTSRVPTYAVPTQWAHWINEYGQKLGQQETVANWWNKVIGTFKVSALAYTGFLTRNQVTNTWVNYLARGFDVLPDYKNYVKAVKVADPSVEIIPGYSAGKIRDLMQRYTVNMGGYAGDLTKEPTYLGKTLGKAAGWWRDINIAAENYSRGALFINGLRNGKTPFEAAKQVMKYQFDYAQLTPFEVSIRKNAVPFYTWTRKNIPLLMETLLAHPEKYRDLAMLKHAVSGGQGSENVPDWWNQQDVWQTKFKDKEGNPLAVSVGLPYSDLNMLSGNPAGMLGPAGGLVNAVQGYDPFMHKEIQAFKGERKPLMTIGEKEILNLPPKIQYTIAALNPAIKRYVTDLSAEASRVAAGTQKPGEELRILSKFIGVRLMPNVKDDQEKRKLIMLLKDINDFKRYQEQENPK